MRQLLLLLALLPTTAFGQALTRDTGTRSLSTAELARPCSGNQTATSKSTGVSYYCASNGTWTQVLRTEALQFNRDSATTYATLTDAIDGGIFSPTVDGVMIKHNGTSGRQDTALCIIFGGLLDDGHGNQGWALVPDCERSSNPIGVPFLNIARPQRDLNPTEYPTFDSGETLMLSSGLRPMSFVIGSAYGHENGTGWITFEQDVDGSLLLGDANAGEGNYFYPKVNRSSGYNPGDYAGHYLGRPNVNNRWRGAYFNMLDLSYDGSNDVADSARVRLSARTISGAEVLHIDLDQDDTLDTSDICIGTTGVQLDCDGTVSVGAAISAQRLDSDGDSTNSEVTIDDTGNRVRFDPDEDGTANYYAAAQGLDLNGDATVDVGISGSNTVLRGLLSAASSGITVLPATSSSLEMRIAFLTDYTLAGLALPQPTTATESLAILGGRIAIGNGGNTGANEFNGLIIDPFDYTVGVFPAHGGTAYLGGKNDGTPARWTNIFTQAIDIDADGNGRMALLGRYTGAVKQFLIDLGYNGAADSTDVCLLDTGLDADCDGTLDKEVRSMYWGAGAMSADGTDCSVPSEVSISSGPKFYTIACGMGSAETDGFIHGSTVLPDGIDIASDATFEVTSRVVTDNAGATAHGYLEIQCVAADATVGSSWSGGANLDITQAAADVADDLLQDTSATVDLATCSAGATLFWRFKICDTDATPSTGCTSSAGAENDHQIVGMKMEYTVATGD